MRRHLLLAPALLLAAAASASAQTRLATLVGKSDHDEFSQSADFLGDIDGDGCDDLIVGSPGYDDGADNTGRVVVYGGGTCEVLKKRNGSGEWDRYGNAVAALGDVDGDGVGDYAVGAGSRDSGGLTDNGTIYVYSGATHAQLFTIVGTADEELVGEAVAGVGDIDGDGRGDILSGGWDFDSGAGFDAGRVTVYSGADGSVIYQLDGEVSNGRMGTTVSDAGDVDFDGELDFYYGSYQGSGSSTGRVWVRSGVDGSLIHQVDGGLIGTKLGTSIAALGDVDKDGYDDVIAGGYQDDTAANNAGIAYVISGQTGGNLYAPTGTLSADRFGWMVSGVGDVNNDTFPDFVVGRPGFDDAVSNVGTAYVYSGFDGGLLFEFRGDQEGLYFGSSTAGPGDWNGDGTTDFALGAVGDAEGLGWEGTLVVYEFKNRATFAPGDRIEGVVPFAGAAREVVFRGLDGMKLKLTMTGLTGTLQPKVTLFDPAGEPVWTEKFDHSDGEQSASKKLRADGLFRLRIEGRNDTTGSFALVTGRKDSDDMETLQTKLKDKDAGYAVAEFRALDGAVVDISVTPNGKWTEAPDFSVTDRNGNEVDVSGLTTVDGNDVRITALTFDDTDVYRVVVDGYPGSDKAKVKVKVTLTQPDPGDATIVLP